MVNVVPHQILMESRKVFKKMKKKKSEPTEDEERAWEKTQDWSNPFGEDGSSRKDRKKKEKKKKKSSRRRHTEEELSEMSSQAEFMLDDLLGDEDEGVQKNAMVRVDEENGDVCDDDSVGVVRHGDVVNNEKGMNPFDDPEEEEEDDGEEFDRQGFKNLLKDTSAETSEEDDEEEEKEEPNTNPFDDSDEEDMFLEEDDNEVEKTHNQGGTNNPYEDDSEADDEASSEVQEDDDSTIEPPEEGFNEHQGEGVTIPFDDDSIAESDEMNEAYSLGNHGDNKEVNKKSNTSQHKAGTNNPFEEDVKNEKEIEATDTTASNSFDSEEQIETIQTESGVETRCVVVQPTGLVEPIHSAASQDPADEDCSTTSEQSLKRSATDDTSDDFGASSDEEDIIESSKRLLRMADKRLQYQQHNDEVSKLKTQLETTQMQAQAMSEQLRRAVETKCDLVLAHTEMERCHEQDLIAKDDEINDLTVYARELMEQQALNELNFMNEISSLSKKIDDMGTNYKSEAMEKDFQIAQLEMKVSSMKTGSVRGNSSRSAFKSRFLDTPSVASGEAAPMQSVVCI